MKICFVSSLHPPLDKRVFDKEARSLAAYGYDVVHLAPGDGSTRDIEGVQIVTYTNSRSIFGRLAQLAKLFRLAFKINADVYHCNEVDSFMIGVVLKIVYRKKCVFDVHEHYPEDFAEFHCPVWLRPIAKTVVSALINIFSRAASGVVLAKSSLIEDFSHLPQDRVYLVENFVSLSALAPPTNEHKRASSIRLIHLGLIGKARGWPQLLSALDNAHNKEVELFIVGTINDGSEKEFHESVARLGLGSRVRYKAWMPYHEAMDNVRSADVGIVAFQKGFHSHIHALPHKMFDYMACELALIVPDFAVEVAAIVKDAECGLLVDVSEPKSIASAIDYCCENPTELQKFGRNGRKAVMSRFNWETTSEKLLTLYRNLEKEMTIK